MNPIISQSPTTTILTRPAPYRTCRRPARGALVSQRWVPHDIWYKLAVLLTKISDIQLFQRICAASNDAVQIVQQPRQRLVRDQFNVCSFLIPEELMEKVLMVHVVPPDGESLILFVDESESGNGVDLAWLRGTRLRRTALGLENVPASTVSNIQFSPDGTRIALLVTLAHGSLIPEELDPLHRLRGWEDMRTTDGKLYEMHYDPCEDCTVQIIDLMRDENGHPSQLTVHTFSHVFVPEYGFDMVWRNTGPEAKDGPELAFAAMLHSAAGAATYLVRWKSFYRPLAKNYVFMACIDGASTELLHDKRQAMMTFEATRCTSRIELAQNAQYIFFDTVSKFGILRFDQVVDASKSKVTRADLPNNPRPSFWRSYHSTHTPIQHGNSRSVVDSCNSGAGFVGGQNDKYSIPLEDLKRSAMITAQKNPSFIEESARISRMSPDGSLLCSIVGVNQQFTSRGTQIMHVKHVEMRSSLTGRLIYRRMIVRPHASTSKVKYFRMHFEKSGDIAQLAMGFSCDSSLLMVWDTQLTSNQCLTTQRLPLVFDARTGKLIQDFSKLSQLVEYEHLQMSPDALTIYGTRVSNGCIVMDAIDILSGTTLKTVSITGRVHSPMNISPHSIYILPDRQLYTVSRGCVDVLWETTRGSLGCGWSAELDPDASSC